ncbi:MAG: hypothetical protein ACK4GL_08810 [Flavobacteriales bacterium]
MIRKIFFALLCSISQGFSIAQSANTALDQSFGLCEQISAFLPSLNQFPTPTPYSFAKVLVLADDKIMVSGPFRATLNGSSRNYLLRLHANGTVDESFNSFGNSLPVNQPSIVTKLIPLADGKYLICGAYSQVVGNASQIIGVYRIHSDGSIDNSFNTFILSGDALDMGGLPNGNASAVYDMDLMPDGKIVIGGNFHQFGNDSINCIAMLNTDGTLFNNFSSPFGPVWAMKCLIW